MQLVVRFLPQACGFRAERQRTRLNHKLSYTNITVLNSVINVAYEFDKEYNTCNIKYAVLLRSF